MLSRRGFILSGAAVGGGLIVGYGYLSLDDGDASRKFAASGAPATPLNAWLKIANDGTVICGIHRAEMGQGVVTTLAMLLAEELDADWGRVTFEFLPVDRDYYNFGMLLNGQPLGDPAASWGAATGTWAIRQVFHALGMSMTISSSSTVDAWDTLRPAGAAARQMLLAAAAEEWQTPAASLRTEQGFVIDDASGRRAGYGELAESAARQTPPADVAIKTPAEWQLVGTNPPRLDAPMKCDGTAVFGIDVQLPGMLHAAIVHSPVAGTNVASFDAEDALAMPGVETAVLAGAPGRERAVAVIADNSWHALQASKQVTIEAVQPERLVDSDSLRNEYARLASAGDAVVFTDTAEGEDSPGFDEQLAGYPAERRIMAEYSVPFLAHLCMEPMNCTARFDGDALEIWAPTQANSISRDVAAKMSGLDTSRVTLHTTFLGGGFGRRAEMDFVEQAVAAAMAVPGRPVQCFWSREQDLRHDAFRPAARCRIEGALDDAGSLALMDYRVVTQSVVASYETRTPTPRGGEAATDKSVVEAVNPPVYPLEHLRLSYVPAELHVPAGYWRSVAHSWTTFFMESFIDELAIAAGQDPLEYRRTLVAGRERHSRVLDTLAAKLGQASGDGIGYSLAESHASVVAQAVEVSAPGGVFDRVTRVVCAVDCGPVVHPDNVIAQMEGSIIDGLSAALHGSLEIREGRIVQGNFDRYRRLTLAECPAIEVHLVDSTRKRPGGVGEPGVPGVAPALTNAIHAATGRRIRDLPVANANG